MIYGSAIRQEINLAGYYVRNVYTRRNKIISTKVIEMKKIATWKGNPVEELSKEELIEALNWAANEIQRLMKEKEHERKFFFDTFVRTEPLNSGCQVNTNTPAN